MRWHQLWPALLAGTLVLAGCSADNANGERGDPPAGDPGSGGDAATGDTDGGDAAGQAVVGAIRVTESIENGIAGASLSALLLDGVPLPERETIDMAAGECELIMPIPGQPICNNCLPPDYQCVANGDCRRVPQPVSAGDIDFTGLNAAVGLQYNAASQW